MKLYAPLAIIGNKTKRNTTQNVLITTEALLEFHVFDLQSAFSSMLRGESSAE